MATTTLNMGLLGTNKKKTQSGTGVDPQYAAYTQGTALDPNTRAAEMSRLQETIAPQIQQGVNKVTSTVNRFNTGKTGASLMRDVFSPLNQTIANYQLEQERRGQDLAATLPFNVANLNLAERGQNLQEELGRGNLGLSTKAQALQEELGRGNLGLSREAQALQAELGRGNLGLSREAQALQAELGRGNLGLSREAQALQAELGRGNLGLSTKAQALQEAQLYGGGTVSGEYRPTLAGQEFAAGQTSQQQLDNIAKSLGLPNSQALTLLAQTDPEKFSRIFGQYNPTYGR